MDVPVLGRRAAPTKRRDKRVVGAAGETYVLFELLRRGYIAARAPEGVATMDLIVADDGGERLAAIQVKARQGRGSSDNWVMDRKHESIRGDRLFYAFVDLGETVEAVPQVFIVPADIVADACALTHRLWMALPKKTRLDTPKAENNDRRQIRRDYSRLLAGAGGHPYGDGWMEPYRDAWHLLGIEAPL